MATTKHNEMTPEIIEDTRFVLLSEGWKPLGKQGLFIKGLGAAKRLDQCLYYKSFDWLNPVWSKTILQLNKIACDLLDANIMTDDEDVMDANEDAVRRIESIGRRYHSAVDNDYPPHAFSALVEAIKLLNNHNATKNVDKQAA